MLEAHSGIPDPEPHTAAAGVSRSTSSSISAPINFIQVDGLRIAHKVIGNGEPIVFLARFRGTLNDWDPAFVDAVAKSYRVILFDGPGVGLSTGAVQKASPNGQIRRFNFPALSGLIKRHILDGRWAAP
jgi:pimeloyl-ACP methyl ester carboxylesterase